MSSDGVVNLVWGFLAPRLDRRFAIRLACVAGVSVLFFGLVCRPCIINGESMVPTYPSRGFVFCWRPVFWLRKPRRGDVVMVRFVGRNVLLLKRVVALAGDTVEFRGGQLYVNSVAIPEPWNPPGRSDWNLEPRQVEPGNVYVVGDNRSMSIDDHVFGQVSAKRLEGVPVF